MFDAGWGVFWIGCAGGIANEILHWWGLRENPNLPTYARSALYWVVTIAMVVLGGLIAWLQIAEKAEPYLAFQLGLAAPMLLQKLSKVVPEKQGGMSAGLTPTVHDFIRG